MSIFSADIFTRLDWLTKKVNILLAYMARTLAQKATYDENNPKYLELIWNGSPPYTSVNDYNSLWATSPGFIPFTGIINDTYSQKLFGGGNVEIKNGDLYTGAADLRAINDPHGMVVSLNNSAFNTFLGLTYVNLPGVQIIDKADIFAACTVNYVNLPNLTVIGQSNTFYNCNQLQYINMPRLRIIDQSANSTFYNCVALSSISLPSLTTIYGISTFDSCAALSNINVPALTTLSSVDCASRSYTFVNMTSITGTLTISQIAASGCSLTVSGANIDVEDFTTTNPGVTVIQV